MGTLRVARTARQLVFIMTLVSAWTSFVTGQEVAGSLVGRVSTGDEPLADAQVVVSGANLLGTRTVDTDKHGLFRVFALPPGNYRVRISKIGVRPLVVEQIKVRVGEMTTIGSVQTEAQPFELSEIRVTADRRTVDPVHTTVGGTLDSADFAALPSDRDYKSIIAVLPQANLSYYGDAANVSGSTGSENMYFIDGVNITSPFDAATGTSLPHNFVRAVEVKAGGYEAQFGRALGGVVNAVTYSGTNDREGQVFVYFTTGGLTAKPKALADLRETSSANYDFGWRLSGPIRRDRIWYSAAYNPRIDRVDSEIAGLGTHRQRTVGHVFATKLTWAATPEGIVEFSVFGDPTSSRRVSRPGYATGLGITTPINLDPYLTRGKSGGITESLRVMWPFGARFVAEGSLAHSTGSGGWKPETTFGATEPLYLDQVNRSFEGGVGLFDTWTFSRSSAILRGTALLGRHTAVAGIEYEDSQVSREINTTGMGVIFRNDATVHRVTFESATGDFHNRTPTIYVQDSWHLAGPLTLSAGLRWSQQTLTGASGHVAQKLVGEWQPRLGVTYQFGSSGRQRLMASFGRFYQQMPLNLSSYNYVDYIFVQTRHNGDPRQSGSTQISIFADTSFEVDFARSIEALKAENLDEFTLGYEALLGAATKITVRAIHRNLRSSFGWGVDFSLDPSIIMGTPGKGKLSFLPPPTRDYTALQISGVGDWRDISYRASYVLSRTWGNYPGLYNSDILGPGGPNNPTSLSHAAQRTNSTGWLPNDRTHVVKVTAFYAWPRGVTGGAFLTWASGTPLNDFGTPAGFSVLRPVFLAQRGSIGRAPSIWDLNLRLSANLPRVASSAGRLVFDILHVGNPQKPVALDQAHFTGIDSNGVQINPNPNYLKPLVFQPPMAARLGIELSLRGIAGASR